MKFWVYISLGISLLNQNFCIAQETKNTFENVFISNGVYNSFAITENVNTYNLLVGIKIQNENKIIRPSIGFSIMPETRKKAITRDNKTYKRSYELFYFTLARDVVFPSVFKSENLDRFSFNFHNAIGFGQMCENLYGASTPTASITRRKVLVIEVGGALEYKIFDWVSLKAGGGYRPLFGHSSVFTLGSAYYHGGMVFKLLPIYGRVRKDVG